MIQIVLEQHRDGNLAGKWDIYVHDHSEAGDLLLFSNQGYENREFAESLVERLFRDDGPSSAEPVDLLTKWANGRGKHRMIR